MIGELNHEQQEFERCVKPENVFCFKKYKQPAYQRPIWKKKAKLLPIAETECKKNNNYDLYHQKVCEIVREIRKE